MTRVRLFLLPAVFLLSGFLAGCGGGGAKAQSAETTTTIGLGSQL